MRYSVLLALLLVTALIGCAGHDQSAGQGDATTKPHHSPLVHY